MKALVLSELAIHEALVAHLRAAAAPGVIWFHVPNGEKRDAGTARKLKRLGVLPGVADMIYLLPGGRVVFHELKTEGRALEPQQRAFRDAVTALGCEFHVTHGLDDALFVARSVGALRSGGGR